MSIINYIEHLAGKDKLEIEFHIHDYIIWAELEYTRKLERELEEKVGFQLYKLLKCYYFETQFSPYPHFRIIDFKFRGFNIVSEIIVNEDLIKVTFTKESLYIRVLDNWLTRIC